MTSLRSIFFLIAIAGSAFTATTDIIGNRPHPALGAGAADAEDSALQQEVKSENAYKVISPYQVLGPLPHLVDEEETEGQKMARFLSQERKQLDQLGIDFFLSYTSNIAGNPVGGEHPNGFTYADFFYLGGIFRTKELFGWPSGGEFFMSVAQVDGNSLSQKNIGNQFDVQEIYVGQTFYWYQLFYEQHFYEDRIALKMGRLSTGNDFATSPLYWFYMNGGIDGSPQALLINEGISYYATATWGSALKVHLSDFTTAKVGVYQVTPGSEHGLTWNIYPNDGVLLMGQLSWNPEFSFSGSPLSHHSMAEEDEEEMRSSASKNPVTPASSKNFKGHYWMGGYYSTSCYNESLNISQQPNSFGLYWHADQTVYRPDPANDSGLVLWSVLTLSPQQSISFMPFQVNAGAVYTGLIPGRKADATIFGVAYGNYSPNFAAIQNEDGGGFPTYELVYETGYRICLTPTAYIQPDLQWIINPGGTGTIPNALVIGAQIGVNF